MENQPKKRGRKVGSKKKPTEKISFENRLLLIFKDLKN